MKIGWMIRGSGIFGSVREALETGAALERAGHKFIYYTDELDKPRWLPSSEHLDFRKTELVLEDELDVLVFSDMFQHIQTFHDAPCAKKIYCLMGFDPSLATDIFLSPAIHDVIRRYPVIADSPWQLSIAKEYGATIGPAIGGVNTSIFRPVPVQKTADVSWSGDHRERKGGDTVRKAIDGLSSTSYFNKALGQDEMAAAICSGVVFVDGHRRGGWCNPVIEAMACGMPVVCTRTPCNSDFAIDGHNCIRVAMDDAPAMRRAIDRLLKDEDLRTYMAENALKTAAMWSHDMAAEQLIQWLGT